MATTTGLGAAIGAAAGGGIGAAIGATVGLAAGGIGVSVAKGHPVEIYPETMLTFRLEAPVAISTGNATGAFRYAEQEDYSAPQQARMAQRPPAPVYRPYPYPYYSPYYAPYYGSGVAIYVGPRYYRGYRRW